MKGYTDCTKIHFTFIYLTFLEARLHVDHRFKCQKPQERWPVVLRALKYIFLFSLAKLFAVNGSISALTIKPSLFSSVKRDRVFG